jgi:hypothetical protein
MMIDVTIYCPKMSSRIDQKRTYEEQRFDSPTVLTSLIQFRLGKTQCIPLPKGSRSFVARRRFVGEVIAHWIQ